MQGCTGSSPDTKHGACRFSHPAGSLSRSAIEINDGAGLVESLNSTGIYGDLCGGFTIRAKTRFSAWETLQTTVKVKIKGQEVTDAYGKTFPDVVSNSTLDHRCVLCHACFHLQSRLQVASGLGRIKVSRIENQ